IAYVPPQEKSIIVEAEELPLLDTVMGNNGKHAIKQPRVTCLAIVLLHETGHIALRHSGRFDASADKFVITPRNREEADRDVRSRLVDAELAMTKANSKNFENNQELEADSFVAKQLKDAGADTANVSRWTNSITVAASLTMVCFNLSAARMLKAFEADNLLSINRNTLYWDNDDEHPNLEYRMLRIN